MKLTLTVLRCPPSVAPELREVNGGDFSIGRGPGNDWVLTDPDKFLSKRHCVIACWQGNWQVAGTSANGTFINGDRNPLESQVPRVLKDGDRLRLGAYEIEARLIEERRSPWADDAPGGLRGLFGGDPFRAADQAASMQVLDAQAGPAPSPDRAPGSAAASGDLMAAFLHGAGMAEARPRDPLRTMEQLGASFRAMVSGVRRALIARAEVKRELRIEATEIRMRGNNLLKFSTSDDDALAGLLGTGRPTDMSPAEAMADALTDMRVHDLATMAAMQEAVRALVARLGPEHARNVAARAGGMMLPGARKGRAFDAYALLHAEISRGLTEDFDRVFGKRFARAYEQALHDLSATHKPAGRRPARPDGR